jgi:protein-disulfide isomerase
MNKKRWYLLAVLVLLIVLAGILIWSPWSTMKQEVFDRPKDPSMGWPESKIMLVEYGDFACEPCKAFFSAAVREQVLLEYGGEIVFLWKDFPVTTGQSSRAAEAAQCAYEQERFWEYHNLLFYHSPIFSDDDLKAYAVSASLDLKQFNECFDSGKYRLSVQEDLLEARRLGFTSPPSFTINGEPLVGLPTLSRLKQVIDRFVTATLQVPDSP